MHNLPCFIGVLLVLGKNLDDTCVKEILNYPAICRRLESYALLLTAKIHLTI